MSRPATAAATANFIWPAHDAHCPCCRAAEIQESFGAPDRLFERDRTYSLGECPACKSIFLLAGGSWSAAEAYPPGFFGEIKMYEVNGWRRLFASYLFPRLPPEALDPVVDMGCGTGNLVAYLAGQGRAVSGVEMDGKTVQIARAAGRAVVMGSWETYAAAPASLGTLIMDHVIEHLVAPPDAVFARAHELVKPGGYWIFRTPNAASWGHSRFGETWHPLDAPRHTVIYSPQGVRSLAGRHGWTPIHLRYSGRAFDLAQSARYSARARRDAGWARCFAAAPGFLLARLAAFVLNTAGKGDAMEFCLQRNNAG